MRVYVFMIVGACVRCHSPSISSGPRVISVLNRTLLCLCLPSLYLVSLSLLLLHLLAIGQEGGLRTCWSWQPRAEIKHEWVEMKRLSHRLLINCFNCFRLQLSHHYSDKFIWTLSFVRYDLQTIEIQKEGAILCTADNAENLFSCQPCAYDTIFIFYICLKQNAVPKRTFCDTTGVHMGHAKTMRNLKRCFLKNMICVFSAWLQTLGILLLDRLQYPKVI